MSYVQNYFENNIHTKKYLIKDVLLSIKLELKNKLI